MAACSPRSATSIGLKQAGGELHWYQPIAWYTLKRLNNRTHRDLLIVDGEVAFIGGMGVADYWIGPPRRGQPWRDTMIRVYGELAGLQTSFAENWLEASGEILAEEEFRASPAAPSVRHKSRSWPTARRPRRATRARMLFQILVASARESICIASPYFIPDRRLCAGARARGGAAATVLVPGRWNNHPLTRLASRRRYGRLLEGGVAIHEYQPAMMHAKILIVDHAWSVVGSTNFDNRSFGLNDEVNVAILQRCSAAKLEADFRRTSPRAGRSRSRNGAVVRSLSARSRVRPPARAPAGAKRPGHAAGSAKILRIQRSAARSARLTGIKRRPR